MAGKYEQRGVSFSKTDVHKAIANIDKGIVPGAFCKVIPDFSTNSPDHGIIMHADGAGTKSSLAYAYWKETGNMQVWKDIAQDAIVMNIDDMLCAGADEHFIISTTIGRNKKLIPGEIIAAIIEGVEEMVSFCNDHGVKTSSAGGETADVGDLVKTIIVDSTVFARIQRDHIISNSSITGGDVIVGLASFGTSSYEKAYNSGMGSNGLTSARHDVFHASVGKKYPETYDNSLPSEVVYNGKYKLTDPSPVNGIDMGRFVLSPTRSYLPVLKAIFNEFRAHIHGIIHCTGGAQTKVLNFADNVKIIKNNMFPIPDLFKIIQQSSGTDWKEMYSVFNMGHRMELYLPEIYADDIVQISRAFGVEAQIIGYCEKAVGKSLTIQNEFDTYIWE